MDEVINICVCTIIALNFRLLVCGLIFFRPSHFHACIGCHFDTSRNAQRRILLEIFLILIPMVLRSVEVLKIPKKNQLEFDLNSGLD